MGLDVYLCWCPDLEKKNAVEAQWEALSESWHAQAKAELRTTEYTDAVHGRVKELTGAYAAEHGIAIGEYGDLELSQDIYRRINLPSAKYPDHYFKIGYLQSSYNAGGINYLSDNLFGQDLYTVFFGDGHRSEDYEFRPDWKACKPRAEAYLSNWCKAAEKHGNYRCKEVSSFFPASALPDGTGKALEAFHRVLGKVHRKGNFSCREGYFWLSDDAEVLRAAIPGTLDFFGKTEPCFYLIFEGKKSAYDWYVKAAEITLEMIDWVLAQPDPENYVLAWSS